METIQPPSSGRVIFREGLIFGVLLGLVDIGLSILSQTLAQSGLGVLFSLLIVLLWLGTFFWAGARGAKQTGRVGTGSLTGLVTAVFAGIIAFIYLIVYASIQAPVLSQQITDIYARRGQDVPTNMTGTLLLAIIIGGFILWLLGIGMGAGMGALGGLLGRSQSTVVPLTYPVNPGYGQPPMQPPYAPQYPPPYMPPYPNQPPQWPPYPNQPPQWPPQQ